MYKYKSIFGSHLDLVKKTTRECSPDFNEVDLELLLAFLVVGTVFSHIRLLSWLLNWSVITQSPVCRELEVDCQFYCSPVEPARQPDKCGCIVLISLEHFYINLTDQNINISKIFLKIQKLQLEKV